MENREFLEQWNYSIYYNDGYMSLLYIYQNTKSEPKYKLLTLGYNDVSMKVHHCNRCTVLVKDADGGRDCTSILV